MTEQNECQRAKLGVWIIGAAGNTATTTLVGAMALARGLFPPTGLITSTAPLASLPLVSAQDLVFGGHELPSRSLTRTAHELCHREGLFRETPLDGEDGWFSGLKEDLAAVEQEVRPGTASGVGVALEALAGPWGITQELPGEAVERLKGDLISFRERHGLDRVVVINLASTEPAWKAPLPKGPEELAQALQRSGALPASSLYAMAALDLGLAYINFTPSVGSAVPALHELAKERGAVHMGNDGKTGETLVKSALAPLFAVRNLQVQSWVGHNILGNLDGQILAHPENQEAKITSKSSLLGKILGYTPPGHVGIHPVAPLGDWKVAWDHILFSGFLGTRMTMQFIWQGNDSALAAPLVLDLVRLADLAQRRGEKGLLPYLALFFKSPLGVEEHRLEAQHRMLLKHLRPELGG